MSDAGDELPYRRKPFAVQQLFLCSAQVFVSLTCLFIKYGAIDGAGNLAANRNQQVHVCRRKLPRRASSHHEAADDAVLGPENHNIRGGNSFFDLRVAKNGGQWQTLCRDESRVRVLDVLQQLGLYGNRWEMPGIFRAVPRSGHAAQLCAALIEKVERSSVQAEKLGHLPKRAMQRVAEVQGLRQRLADGIQHHQLAIAPADFQLGLLAFRNVLKKTLVCSNISGSVAHGD